MYILPPRADMNIINLIYVVVRDIKRVNYTLLNTHLVILTRDILIGEL